MRFPPVDRRAAVVLTAGTPNPASERTSHRSAWGVRGESMNLSHYKPTDPDMDRGDRQTCLKACGKALSQFSFEAV
jgi:hypothetical protein